MSSGGNGEYGSIGSSFSMGPTFMSPPLPRRPSAYPGTSLTTPTASPQRRRRLNPSLVREAASEHIDPSSHPGTVASSSFPSFSATPRESMAAHSLHGATYRSEIQMGETVDLTSVYKVHIRYWDGNNASEFLRWLEFIPSGGRALHFTVL
jgi:hypothetical protein